MRDAEQAAFTRGVEVEALMDRAGSRYRASGPKFFPNPATCIVLCRKRSQRRRRPGGGGTTCGESDGKSTSACLREKNCGELTQKKLKTLRDPDRNCNRRSIARRAARTLQAPRRRVSHSETAKQSFSMVCSATGAKHFSANRSDPLPARSIGCVASENAFVFAVDLPTGLDADSGENDPEDSVVADFTITIGFAKHGSDCRFRAQFCWSHRSCPADGSLAGRDCAQ